MTRQQHVEWCKNRAHERTQRLIGATLAWVTLPFMLVGALYVIGEAIDVQGDRSMERHRCLQEATNGLEIEKCKR